MKDYKFYIEHRRFAKALAEHSPTRLGFVVVTAVLSIIWPPIFWWIVGGVGCLFAIEIVADNELELIWFGEEKWTTRFTGIKAWVVAMLSFGAGIGLILHGIYRAP